MAEIKLGDKIKDSITGYTGIVVAVTEWLNGCLRYTLQGPPKKKGDQPDDGYCIDYQQAVLIKAGAFKEAPTKKAKKRSPGGPMPSPSRPRDPRR